MLRVVLAVVRRDDICDEVNGVDEPNVRARCDIAHGGGQHLLLTKELKRSLRRRARP